MRVFVTGATGFIGSAIVQELIEAGHHVTGLARSDAAATSLEKAGARVHRGTLEDLESLRRGAAAAEGAIHTAFFHEFTHARVATRLRVLFGGAPGGIISRFTATTSETDKRAIETIGRALKGSDRALVVAAGTLSLKAGELATEDDPTDPNAVGAQRISEASALATTAYGVRASVVRLPPFVHGDGDRAGFTPRLVAIARKKGVSATIGDGANRLPAVHRLDAAHLFRLALEKGSAKARYHGVGDEGIPFKKIAESIGGHLRVPIVSKSPAEATKHFGFLGPSFGVDNPTSSALTQERLEWRPARPGMLPDLDGTWYFSEQATRKG